jgi:hypothetical protein
MTVAGAAPVGRRAEPRPRGFALPRRSHGSRCGRPGREAGRAQPRWPTREPPSDFPNVSTRKRLPQPTRLSAAPAGAPPRRRRRSRRRLVPPAGARPADAAPGRRRRGRPAAAGRAAPAVPAPSRLRAAPQPPAAGPAVRGLVGVRDGRAGHGRASGSGGAWGRSSGCRRVSAAAAFQPHAPINPQPPKPSHPYRTPPRPADGSHRQGVLAHISSPTAPAAALSPPGPVQRSAARRTALLSISPPVRPLSVPCGPPLGRWDQLELRAATPPTAGGRAQGPTAPTPSR